MTYVPPPVQNPPPPQKSYTTMAVVGILGCGAFFIFCFLIVAIFVAYRVGQENGQGLRRSNSIFEPATPTRTAGRIVRVGDAAAGWTEYKLEDYGLSMDLPAMPQQADMSPEDWDIKQKRSIETFASYESLYPSSRINIEGYLYRITFENEDPTWVIQGDLEKSEHEAGYTNVKQTHKSRVVDGRPAVEMDYTYSYRGSPSITRELIIMGPRSVRTIAFSYWTRQDAAASADFEQCVNSIKFLPANEDKFGQP